MSKPNFFIVGAPKAGTTSLYHYLEEHPEVYMSPVKETNYFSFEEIKAQGLFYGSEFITTAGQYAGQFARAEEEKAIGEASVSYLFYPSVPGKIRQFNPAAKIIIVLREPVARGYSHYLMDQRLGLVPLRYGDIVHRRKAHPQGDLFYQQYVQLGLYYHQVKRYLDTFGREAVRIFLYDDLVGNIDGVVKEMYHFLGVDSSFRADTGKNHNAFSEPKNKLIGRLYAARSLRKAARRLAGENAEYLRNLLMRKGKKPALDPALKEELAAIYRPDMVKTQELIQRDLTSWL